MKTILSISTSFLIYCSLFFSYSLALNPNLKSTSIDQFSEKNFWKHWGDSKAELNAYSVELNRYGETRKGTAVSIFVTENFSKKLGVKADHGKHPKSDISPVMKLNLVKDFQTGIYDYNMMTSSFIEIESGKPLKNSFSSQEWCGHVYHQRRFKDDSLESVSHSYFDGEADKQEELALPKNTLSEDNIHLWARGLASPFLKPGEEKTVSFFNSMEEIRIEHIEAKIMKAEISLSAETSNTKVEAGSFKARIATIKREDGKIWNFTVEVNSPYRILSWNNSKGEKAELLGSSREPYWQLQKNGHESFLKKLGLKKLGLKGKDL